MKATIKKIVKETPSVKTFYLSLEKEISFRPGQFVSVINNDNGKVIRRAYSISHWTKQPAKNISITLNEKKGGALSPYLFNRKVDEVLEIEGPFGFFTLAASSNPVVFIAAGTGITPFMAMMESLEGSGKKMSLVYSVRTPEDLIFLKDIERLAQKSLVFIPTITRECPETWKGARGRITVELLKNVVNQDSEVYICGSSDFVKAVQESLLSLGLSKEQMHVEKW